MPRRAQYKTKSKIQQITDVLAALPVEEVRTARAHDALKAAKIKYTSSELSTARRRVSGMATDTFNLNEVLLVKRTINSVGGLEKIDYILSVIRRIGS